MKYLKGSLEYKLRYNKDSDSNITGYSDADWANDPDTRKSVTGAIFVTNGGAISWLSKRQRTVALSTVEAEYIALSTACQEALWLKELQRELNPEMEKRPIQIYSDNNGAISLCKNACVSQRSKHIDVRYHFIKENVRNGKLTVKHIASEEMIADMLTKALPKPKLECHVQNSGLIGFKSYIIKKNK